MSSSTLIEVVGHIVFSFTRSVTEHYNPEDPEFTAESFGFNLLQSTGREWYHQPADELIYQEYSDREAKSRDYLTTRHFHVRVIDACSPEENEIISSQEIPQEEDRSMAWKQFRPSLAHTVCKSMYIGALISLVTACAIGAVYMPTSYFSYKIEHNCEFQPGEQIPLQVQWTRTISSVVSCAFLYIWFFVNVLLLFRPFQLAGVKGRLVLLSGLTYCLDTLYRIALQVLGISHSKISDKTLLNTLFLTSVCLQVYLIADHFYTRPKQKLTLFLKITLPACLPLIVGNCVVGYLYPVYSKETKEGKLLIAIFSPLTAVIVKAVARICVQRLYNITHPAYSYVLIAPLYFGSAIVFRVLQADLDSLQSIAILGLVHGTAEVIERSTMVVIDHICHIIWKRKSAPWGSFRTPRHERLMADIAIMSMLSESTAIVAVNGYLYLYQLIYLQNSSLLTLIHSFAVRVSVQLVIEWFFNSVSMAIETRYQNMAVMGVWRRQWRRHAIVALVNAVPLAIWTNTILFQVVGEHFNDSLKQICKMPFT